VTGIPLFRRTTPPGENRLGELLLQGHDMIERTAEAHARAWNFGKADRWDLDQTTGMLRWTFPDHVAEAPAQILGSYSSGGGTWMWAWANNSLLPHLGTASTVVRGWGEAHDQAMLTTGRLELTAEQAADLAAVAFRLTGATGLYRAPAGRSDLYLTFGPVLVTGSDGDRRTFTFTTA